MISSATWLLLAQLVAGAGVSSGSGRPAECAALEGVAGGGTNVWERAKTPELRRYCDVVASAASKLAGTTMAQEVVTLAGEAQRLQPRAATPLVLRGRALARLGQDPAAYQALREARSRDPRALDDAAALLAWARVAVRTGHPEEGREAYHALLPRAAALVATERGPAYVEAGLLAMSQGPSGLEEAVAVLRQGRRDAQDVAQAVAMLALALALDRSGEREEARVLLGERGDPRMVMSDARARKLGDLPGVGVELGAVEAFALEPLDPLAARELWRKYVEKSGSPWIDHARQHEAALAARRTPPRPAR